MCISAPVFPMYTIHDISKTRNLSFAKTPLASGTYLSRTLQSGHTSETATHRKRPPIGNGHCITVSLQTSLEEFYRIAKNTLDKRLAHSQLLSYNVSLSRRSLMKRTKTGIRRTLLPLPPLRPLLHHQGLARGQVLALAVRWHSRCRRLPASARHHNSLLSPNLFPRLSPTQMTDRGSSENRPRREIYKPTKSEQ